MEWETRVALHAGGDLTGAEATEVERHLGECSGCQVLWSGVRESLAEIRSAHTSVPVAAHFTAVRSRVIAELERDARRWRRLAWVSGLGVTAALLLLALWPPRAIPDPPLRLASIPPARWVVKPKVVKVPRAVRRPARQVVSQTPRRSPVTVKLQTTDPNIVIYWIAD
jgi:hypothetical protein